MKQTLIFFLFLFFIDAYSQDNSLVEINTSKGKMVLMLYDETPVHRDNFLKLVEEGFYDGQLFHRVIDNFMLQTGDPNSKNADQGELLGMGGTDYLLPAEIKQGLYHKKGAVAAARQSDAVNPEKKSSGSQFYIVEGQIFTPEQLGAFVRSGRHEEFTEEEIKDYTTIGGTPHLDGSYTVFGEIIEGIEVIDSISRVPVNDYNRPVEDISIEMRVIR